MATSKAQIRANRNYEARNRNKTRYDTAKRQAKNFIEPKPNSVLSAAIEEYGSGYYLDDLKDLQIAINKRIQELEK